MILNAYLPIFYQWFFQLKIPRNMGKKVKIDFIKSRTQRRGIIHLSANITNIVNLQILLYVV